jgi:cadmium resistance protein CadD (predicted permease)
MELDMAAILSACELAAVAFAATNIDDLVLLGALYLDPRLRSRTIVLGQVLGMAVPVIGAALVGLAAYRLCGHYSALLGIVPLSTGVLRLRDLRRRQTTDRLGHRVRPQLLAVAGLTAATGADNLTVYVPLFGDAPQYVALYCCVFALLIPVWCATGYALVNNSVLGGLARRAGHLVTPLVTITLGVWILLGRKGSS